MFSRVAKFILILFLFVVCSKDIFSMEFNDCCFSTNEEQRTNQAAHTLRTMLQVRSEIIKNINKLKEERKLIQEVLSSYHRYKAIYAADIYRIGEKLVDLDKEVEALKREKEEFDEGINNLRRLGLTSFFAGISSRDLTS